MWIYASRKDRHKLTKNRNKRMARSQKTQVKAKDEAFNQTMPRKLGDSNRNYNLLSVCGVDLHPTDTLNTLPSGWLLLCRLRNGTVTNGADLFDHDDM